VTRIGDEAPVPAPDPGDRPLWFVIFVCALIVLVCTWAAEEPAAPAPGTRTLGPATAPASVETTAHGLIVALNPRSVTHFRHSSAPRADTSSTVRRRVTATGYCSCAACCGKSDGITASGAQAAWGTIAAPGAYAFGTRFTIPELGGVFTVRDRGGAIKGARIDIWFPTHAQALAWGRRTVTLLPAD